MDYDNEMSQLMRLWYPRSLARAVHTHEVWK